MCLLMWKPAEVTLTRRDVFDYVENNPDGFGILWRDDTNTIRSYKMMGSKKQVWKAYQRYAAGKACALHWRWNTAGVNSMDNTHPFEVIPGLWLMHNGVLSCKSDAVHSDTWYFAHDVMRRELQNHPERIEDETWLKAMKDVIGPGNRLLFWRDGQEEPSIVGESDGLWHKGAWYSNTYAWSRGNPYYFDYQMNYYDDNHPWSKDWDPPETVCNLAKPYDTNPGTTERIEFTGAPQSKEEWEALEDLDMYHRVFPHADLAQEVDRLVDVYSTNVSWIERARMRRVLEVAAASIMDDEALEEATKNLTVTEGADGTTKYLLNAAGDVVWSETDKTK